VAELWAEVQSSSQSVAQETAQAWDHWPALSSEAASTIPLSPPLPTTPTLRPISQPIGERVNAAFGFLGDVLPTPGTSG
jgi:hypothetical protein